MSLEEVLDKMDLNNIDKSLLLSDDDDTGSSYKLTKPLPKESKVATLTIQYGGVQANDLK